MPSTRLFVASGLALSLFMTGCSDEQPASQSQAPEADTKTQEPQLAANQGIVVTGEAAGGYNYVQVRQNGKTFWIAGGGLDTSPGALVEWSQASLMKNFTSKSLDRTFDEIYFVTSVAPRPAPAAPAAAANEGIAKSVMNAAGYSYIQAETAQGERWVAVPATRISEGDRFRWGQAALMRNFTSESLNRTFDEILFASQVQVANGGQAQGAAVNQGTVVSVQQSGGYSYMQVNTPAGEQWVAAPMTRVSEGDTITWSGASLMRNFHAASLDHTFDSILFAGSVQVR